MSESDAVIIEEPDTGPWLRIEHRPNERVYCPRDRRRQPRFEKQLPSGATLIHDFHAGLILRRDYYADFDWTTRSAHGRALGDRSIVKRQTHNERWFVLTTQDTYDTDDHLLSSELRMVEEFRGQSLVRSEEIST